MYFVIYCLLFYSRRADFCFVYFWWTFFHTQVFLLSLCQSFTPAIYFRWFFFIFSFRRLEDYISTRRKLNREEVGSINVISGWLLPLWCVKLELQTLKQVNDSVKIRKKIKKMIVTNIAYPLSVSPSSQHVISTSSFNVTGNQRRNTTARNELSFFCVILFWFRAPVTSTCNY